MTKKQALVVGMTFVLGAAAGRASGNLLSFSPSQVIRAADINNNFSHLHSDIAAIYGGITFTGAVTLPGNPTSALHAATKDYVDGNSTAMNAQVASLETQVAILNTQVASLNAQLDKLDLTTPPATGQVLRWNGTKYVPSN